jgi:hypothetical protein
MSDKRMHRGPHPADHEAFGAAAQPQLAEAIEDLAWLLTRGYAPNAATKLVGDRFALIDRQRMCLQRCACADQALASRRSRELDAARVAGRPLWVDGLNVLTTVEAALAGGVVLAGRDGCLRDMAGMHGHYKRVTETLPAIQLAGSTLERLRPSEVVWFLDKPVSNSGRLAAWIRDAAAEHAWNWRVELVPNPDPILSDASEIVATADSMILDRCARWFNLAREIVMGHVPEARVLDFSAQPERVSHIGETR